MILHGVTDKFVLFTLHKHFKVPTGCILFQQKIMLLDNSLGEVVHPVPALLSSHITKPVAFFVCGNMLQPYKYSCDAGLVSNYSATSLFFDTFIALLKKHSAEKLFALKLPNFSPNVPMGKGEIPELGAMVLILNITFQRMTLTACLHQSILGSVLWVSRIMRTPTAPILFSPTKAGLHLSTSLPLPLSKRWPCPICQL